jgi:hypothetical protein
MLDGSNPGFLVPLPLRPPGQSPPHPGRAAGAATTGPGEPVVVFVSERGSRFTTAGFARMIERAAVGAGLELKAHPNMLRHACGYALATRGTTPGPSRDGSAIGRSPALRSARHSHRIGSRTPPPRFSHLAPRLKKAALFFHEVDRLGPHCAPMAPQQPMATRGCWLEILKGVQNCTARHISTSRNIRSGAMPKFMHADAAGSR